MLKWAIEQIQSNQKVRQLLEPLLMAFKDGVKDEQQVKNRDEIIDYILFQLFPSRQHVLTEFACSISVQSLKLRAKMYQYITERIPSFQKTKSHLKILIIDAVRYGHLDLLKTIQQKNGNSLFNFEDLYNDATSTGNLEILKYLLELNPQNENGRILLTILNNAVDNRHLHIIEYHIQNHNLQLPFSTIQKAIDKGNIDILKCLLKSQNRGCTIESVFNTISRNRTDLFNVLVDYIPTFQDQFNLEEIIEMSLINNRWQVLEIVKTKFGVGLSSNLSNVILGDTSTLKYLYHNRIDDSSLEHLLVSSAIPMESIESIEMIDAEHPNILKSLKVFNINELKPSMQTIQYLLSRMDKPKYKTLFKKAISIGRLDVADYLYQKLPLSHLGTDHIYQKKVLCQLVQLSRFVSDQKCLQTLKWVFERFDHSQPTVGMRLKENKNMLQEVFEHAVAHRNLPIIQYIWDTFGGDSTSIVKVNGYMIPSTVSRSDSNLKWLFMHFDSIPSSSYSIGQFGIDFKEAARLGHLSTIKWLVENDYHNRFLSSKFEQQSLDLTNKLVLETSRYLFENGVIDAPSSLNQSLITLSKNLMLNRSIDEILLFHDMGIPLLPLSCFHSGSSIEHSSVVRLIYFSDPTIQMDLCSVGEYYSLDINIAKIDTIMINNNSSREELFSRLFRNVIIRRYGQLKDNIDQLSRYGYIDQIKKVVEYQEQVVYSKYRWASDKDRDIPYTPHLVTVIKCVVRDGYFDYIQEIWNRLSSRLPEVSHAIIRYAVYYNQFKIFKWAADQAKDKVNDTLFKAIKDGIKDEKHLKNRDEIIDYLPFETFPNVFDTWPTKVTLQSSNLQARVYRYLASNLSSSQPNLKTLLEKHLRNLLVSIVRYGDIDLFKTIQQNQGKGLFNFEHLMCEATSSGNLEMLKHLIQTNPSKDKIPSSVLDKAVDKGHLHIVKFITNHGSHCTLDTIQIAIENGNIDILVYLLQSENEGCSFQSVCHIIDENRTDLFKALVDYLPLKYQSIFNEKDIVKRALLKGRLEVLEIIKMKFGVGLPRILTGNHTNNNILQYVYQNRIDDSSVEHLLISNAIPMDLLESIKMIDADHPHLLKKFNIKWSVGFGKISIPFYSNDTIFNQGQTLSDLIRSTKQTNDNVCVEIFEWLTQRFTNDILQRKEQLQLVFESTSSYRSLTVIQYLRGKFQGTVQVTSRMISLSINAKRPSHLIWLFSQINLNVYLCQPQFKKDFNQMAQLGYLEALKWIVENGHHQSISKTDEISLYFTHESARKTTRYLFENGFKIKNSQVPKKFIRYSIDLDPDLFLLLIDMGIPLFPLIGGFQFSLEQACIVRLLYYNNQITDDNMNIYRDNIKNNNQFPIDLLSSFKSGFIVSSQSTQN
ncbi:hypothetical protein DFA_06407 [Cavenderia fasciculata]|uniref:Ankyrin repeat-containing protein n=1 Tax=Cavenderia fasciculata TaxID=261658 RepID=F4PIX1_CACFS|nr:uncharacterized protein DFA_06407 [Cavenderia fasciculata]EGG24257.1 hypothetical protein DFA_06407 [Cavenderia fasciculata]|eukprot:XP_004362108.1 hypothetical protein DFA_06407 [Cavenderia fasciculata]